jgi:hypothetical protein
LAIRLMLVAVALFALSAPARAGVSFQLGNNPEPDEENILLNSGDTGNPIFGTTNQSNISVRFSSTTDTLIAPSSGQSRVESTDGELQNLTIDIPNGSFRDLIINPNVDNRHDGGTAHITVVANDATSTFDYTLDNGSNFLTIVATGDERLLSVTIDYDSGFQGFQDLRQPRISGPAVVPEPSTMALAFVGVAGLGLKGLRRLRRRPATATA